MYAASQQQGEKRMNTVGIDVGKRMCRAAAAAKNNNGHILDEFFFIDDNDGICKLIKIISGYGKCTAVVESMAN